VDEPQRLQALQHLAVLDSAPEPVFDALVQAAARLCEVPMALISLIDERRQWFKAAVGLEGMAETERRHAFCDHTIRSDAVFEVGDARHDSRFATHSLVAGEPQVRFYAGAPLVLPGGERIGTVCVLDRVPRALGELQREMLRHLASTVVAALAERRRHLDVTAELAASEARYRTLYEATPAILHSIDEQGRLLNVSNQWLDTLGYTRAEVIGRKSTEFLAPESAQYARDVVLPAFFQRGRCERVPYQFVRRDGSLVDVLLSAIQERDGQGRPSRSLAVIENVTENHRLARQLSDSEQRYRSLFENLSSGFVLNEIVLDAEGRPVDYVCLAMNTAFADIAGMRAEQIVGRSGRNMAQPDGMSFEAALARFAPVALTGTPVRSEHGPVRGGRWFDVVAYRPAPGQFAVLVQDITLRKQAKARLQDALKEKETLLKEVYHRVKNNLQVVQSLLNLQRRGLPEGPAHEVLDDSVQRVRAMALVHEKLYQSGNLAAVSLPAYVRDLLGQIGEAAGASRRRLQLRADIPPLEISLDSAIPFGLLITELATNALKHGFAGRDGGTVSIRLQPQADGVLLTVADDGVGLPSGLELPAAGSMGFQLAVNLTRQLGGELQAQPGHGATFQALLTRL
jgi:PAS domain S-box-containing protein